MPLYTVINPKETEVAVAYGTFAPFSVSESVDLTNAQLNNAIRVRGMFALADGIDRAGKARALAALLADLLPGDASTPEQRRILRIRASQQDWQDVRQLLAEIDA